MIEKYERIENDTYRTCNAPNPIARTSIHQKQKPELWNLSKEISNQKELKLVGNQLDNMEVLGTSSRDITK